MIVSCPECNGKVSDTVTACPHCGFKMTPAPPDEIDPLENPNERLPCPYCAEMIRPAASICPFCKGSLSGGVPPLPPDRLPVRRTPPQVKSFVSLAVICALLYLLCWPVGLILNLMWYGEAGNIQKDTRVEPEGKGCLLATLIVGFILLALVFIGFFVRHAEQF